MSRETSNAVVSNSLVAVRGYCVQFGDRISTEGHCIPRNGSNTGAGGQRGWSGRDVFSGVEAVFKGPDGAKALLSL